MTFPEINSDILNGLTRNEVTLLQKQFGKNKYQFEPERRWLQLIKSVLQEPMFILLLVACILYFILGQSSEGVMMSIAMIIVSAISVYQDVRSTRALDALKEYTEPLVKVIRDNKEETLSMVELVPGDILLLEEGMKIPADASILQANDLSLNESIITGESLPVYKNSSGNNLLYQGSTIESGKCIARVTATGNNTFLGKIGKTVSAYQYPKSHLQVQVNRFVKRLALFGFVGFAVTLAINYLHYRDFVTSLLFALTLAMSVLPEEIPVAFSSFMALGAYKMSKYGIISRQPQIIENLGAVTVVCLDKTGTITENRMEVKAIYDYEKDSLVYTTPGAGRGGERVLFFAALASESHPFDSMEIAILDAYHRHDQAPSMADHRMVHEYPLEGLPPMMTHVFESGKGDYTVAAKGAPERICNVCKIDPEQTTKILRYVNEFGNNGYRVLGVAQAVFKDTSFPAKQDDFKWDFCGLLALYDPPKQNANSVLQLIADAGIELKILTGDFSTTAMSIAKTVGMKTGSRFIEGEQVAAMSDAETRKVVNEVSVFTRMYPDAKLKVINALKANGHVVAMTGDGINDATALKSAHIGIAMGKKGTETARRASDLILTDDNLDKIAMAIREGRKILNNLLKAIRYIISIHIPIILIASLPVLFGWHYPNIFTPVHVIFLELIMGPTCSVFFEREPVEQDLMKLPPRKRTMNIFAKGELRMSILLGLAITVSILSLYYIIMMQQYTLEETRTMVFTSLILANLLLTFSARSYTKTLFQTIRSRNNLAPYVVLLSALFLVSLQVVTPFRELFGITTMTLQQFLVCCIIPVVGVGWFELYKWRFRRGSN